MHKTCRKCGTESEVDDSPAAACPSCGVIFAKVEQISVAQRQAIRASGARKGPVVEDDSPRQATSRGGWVLWALCLLSSLAGVGYMGITFMYAKSAPQEAAGMAIAMALAVVPYVLARAVQELRR